MGFLLSSEEYSCGIISHAISQIEAGAYRHLSSSFDTSPFERPLFIVSERYCAEVFVQRPPLDRSHEDANLPVERDGALLEPITRSYRFYIAQSQQI